MQNKEEMKQAHKQWLRRECVMNKLGLYYRNLFPFELIYKWLNYGYKEIYFQRREFSFSLVKGTFVRFQSFKNWIEWRDTMLKERPIKMDIGAMYNLNVKEKANANISPCEKELVIDIDVTDYNDVRFCCSGNDMCEKCWKFMVIACKIVDATLREDLGFQHILWVFSGRRGIHCWVCDDAVRRLTGEERSGIAEYLQLVTGGIYKRKKVQIDEENIHHMVKRALNIICNYFNTVCIQEQDILGTPRKMAMFLAILEDEELKEEIRNRFLECRTTEDRWFAFVTYIKQLQKVGSLKREHKYIVEEIMIQYMYPRLDASVTVSINHLLKCPFSVHPDTGKISVPFNPKEIEKFRPCMAPNVDLLLSEIACQDHEKLPKQMIKQQYKTSMCKSVLIFEQFIGNLEKSREGKKIIIPSEEPLKYEY